MPMGRPLVAGNLLWVVMLIFSLAAMLLTSCTGAEPEITPSTTTAQAATASQPHDFAYSYQSDSIPGVTHQGVHAVVKNTTRIKSVEQLQTYANASTQAFAISNSKDTIVVGTKGVEVLFPANCFVLPYEGAEVKIELKEYKSSADFFFAGLSTLSNGQLLESGGTVYISATCNGQEVAMKEGKQATVAFPTGRAIPDMQTFYGQQTADGSVNWVPSNTFTTAPFKTYNLYDTKMVKKTGTKQSLSILTKHNYQIQALGAHGTCTRFADSSTYKNVLEYFDKNFTLSAADAELLKGSYITYNYKVTDDGTVEKITKAFTLLPKMNNGNQKAIKTAVKRVRAAMLAQLNAMEGLEASYIRPTGYGCRIGYMPEPIETIRIWINGTDVANTGHIRIGQMGPYEYEQATWVFNQARADSVKANDARYNFLHCAKLGWINCDRFYTNPAPKTDIVVKLASYSNTEVKVIFIDIMSVMPAYRSSAQGGYVVSNVPNNCSVKYIAVQNREDGLYFAVKDATTAEAVVTGFEFKPMTVDAIKDELASLK